MLTWLEACEQGDIIVVDRFKYNMAGATDDDGNSGLILATRNRHH